MYARRWRVWWRDRVKHIWQSDHPQQTSNNHVNNFSYYQKLSVTKNNQVKPTTNTPNVTNSLNSLETHQMWPIHWIHWKHTKCDQFTEFTGNTPNVTNSLNSLETHQMWPIHWIHWKHTKCDQFTEFTGNTPNVTNSLNSLETHQMWPIHWIHWKHISDSWPWRREFSSPALQPRHLNFKSTVLWLSYPYSWGVQLSRTHHNALVTIPPGSLVLLTSR